MTSPAPAPKKTAPTLRGRLVGLLCHAPVDDLAAAIRAARATPSEDAYADLALLMESACQAALREQARSGE